MPFLRRLLLRLYNFIRPDQAERELQRELESHALLLEEEFRRRGLTSREATLAARRALGGVERTKELQRDARSFAWLDDFKRDLLHSVRGLIKARGFTIVVVLTLGLGIGVNTAIFSVVNAVLLSPLPYSQPDQLVRIVENIPASESRTGRPERRLSMAPDDARALRQRSKTLSSVGLYAEATVTLTRSTDAAVVGAAQVSPSLFPMLRVTPVHGRLFASEEEQPGASGVVILAYSAWQKYFAGSADLIGRSVNLDGRNHTVVGIMPDQFAFPHVGTEFWTPLVTASIGTNQIRLFNALARVQDGARLETAAAEISTIYASLRGAGSGSGSRRVEVVRVKDEQAAPLRPALQVLIVAVAFVLLIACTNVANLLLARTANREREIAVRAALGAGRSRLVRQVLTESSVLAFLGAAAGLALAFATTRLLTAAWPGNVTQRLDLPRIDYIEIDAAVFLFTLGIAALTGVLFGIMPAARVSRTSPMDVLRDNLGNASGGRLLGHNATRSALVVIETALAMILLAGAGLLIHSFIKLTNVEAGFDPENVLTFQVATPTIPSVQRATFNESLTDRLSRLPGVRFAGYALNLPLQQQISGRVRFEVPGLSQDAMEALGDPPALVPVSRDYLRTIGMPISAGRWFRTDDTGGSPVMVVNRALARRYFRGAEPVGTLVRAVGPTPWEIVGVVDDSRQRSLDLEPVPEFYVLADQMFRTPAGGVLQQMPGRMSFAIRTHRDPDAVTPAVRETVSDLNAGAVVTNVAALDQIVSNSVAAPRFYAALIGTFAFVALVLASVGIYGLLAYSVAQRTREIGVRMALGAPRSEVLRLILLQGTTLAAVGLVIGLAGAAGITRYLAGMLFGLTPLDPSTFIAVSVMFGVVAVLASYVPARRATRVDPLTALRCD
jgi:predicted permease